MAREIGLAGGFAALVDDGDFALVSGFRWHRHSEGYAAATAANSRNIYMHRLILSAPPELTVDHVNSDRLDNRRANLRLATMSQQMMNRGRPSAAKSPYRGVTLHHQSGLWTARIKVSGKNTSLGYFRSPEDAAAAYDRAARALHGEFARLNNAPAGLDHLPGRPKSGFRGVYTNGARWAARLNNRHLGNFADPAEAARCYDRAAREHYGPFARMNFPDEVK